MAHPSGLPPYRQRTPSGHDVPIPEAVFHAILGVSHDIKALGQTVAVNQANTDRQIADLAKVVASSSASWKDKAVTQVGALALAIVAAIGGGVGIQELRKPPAAAPTVVYESALSAALARCQGLAEAEQRYCRDDAYEADKTRRRGRP